MVLQTSSFEFPQRRYAHKEESHYNNGFMQNNDYYGNSSSMQMMRPAPSGFQAPNHYSHGGFSNHGSHGYGPGGSNYSSGMYSHSQNGAMNNRFAAHQSSHMSMGPGRYQYQHQNHGHNSSSSPFHNSSHTWSSKDLDD
ncbi:hypothetical protein LIER_33740 [Lithospermum erythrorhizon]|uniref:Uncharacterized protein n=1 Tax=Lithospermum erythrorhizon TaxID=34254 RepID=A0AAV3S1H2_LITER